MLQFNPTEALRHTLRRCQQHLSLLLIGLLAIGLTACGNGNFPNPKIVEQAIALQVQQIQQPLSKQLKLKPPQLKDIRISDIQISDRDTVMINGEKAYHLSGQYDLALKQIDHQASQRGDRFDIYLQPKQDGKIKRWQLAQKVGGAWQIETVNRDKAA